MFQYKHGMLPDSFTDFFTYSKDLGENRLRESDGNFIIPENNTNINIIFPHVELVKAWNHTSYSDKMLAKTSTYKKSIKNKFLEMYEIVCAKDKCYSCKRN